MTAQPATSGGQPRLQRRRGRSNAVAADYDWILGDGLFHAYCSTLVRGVTPREFMDRIGAQITFDALPPWARRNPPGHL
ncbi:DUF6461 domain-containing protein [Nocardia sp. NPDC049149]|uniref:DUF6461 domain-containing protein n=1 Tax=Nocardia sp. NPDC049149 TaxID=3364315 RepID=UPI0037166F22